MNQKFITLEDINVHDFYEGTIYVGAYRILEDSDNHNDYLIRDLLFADTKYNAPVDSLILLGYFIKATYLGCSGKQKRFYTFKNPYNNEEKDFKIKFGKDNKNHFLFFTEFSKECITSLQVPITALLSCKKNIPFYVMNIIQEFRIGEGNHKLQKLLEYCIEVTEQKYMKDKSKNDLDLINFIQKNRKEKEPPILPDKNPFAYWISN
jgi:hypothetical protein